MPVFAGGGWWCFGFSSPGDGSASEGEELSVGALGVFVGGATGGGAVFFGGFFGVSSVVGAASLGGVVGLAGAVFLGGVVVEEEGV